VITTDENWSRNSKWCHKPELPISLVVDLIVTRFHVFVVGERDWTSVNTVQRLGMLEIKDGGHLPEVAKN